MPPRLTSRARRALVTGLVLALVAGVLAGAWWWTRPADTVLVRAMSLAGPTTERLTLTHWSAVRDAVGQRDGGDEQALLDAAFDADLSSTSALLSSSPGLQDALGFSPATLDWEALAQGPDGALLVLQLGGDDLGAAAAEVGEHLAALGFTAPRETGGIWRGGPDVVSSQVTSITPELQYVSVDPDSGVLLASDTEQYLRQVLDQQNSWWDEAPEGVREVARASGDPVSGVLYSADHACTALAMGQADESDQRTAEGLVQTAGGLDPYTGFALSAQPDGTFRAAMAFEDSGTARRNADARAQLATGEAPGQGGSFGDRFRLGEARAEGDVVTLELEPVDGAFVLSDLSTGPVLFASC